MRVLFLVLVSHKKRSTKTEKFIDIDENHDDYHVEKLGKEWLYTNATEMLKEDTNAEEWKQVCDNESLDNIVKYIKEHTVKGSVDVKIEKAYIRVFKEVSTYVNGKICRVESG